MIGTPRIKIVEAKRLISYLRLMTNMFIEMTGKTLSGMLTADELSMGNLSDVGVTDDTVVRVNKTGRHRSSSPRWLGHHRRAARRV